MNRNIYVIVLCFFASFLILLLFRSSMFNSIYVIPYAFSAPRAFIHEFVYGVKDIDSAALKEENRKLREAILDYEMLKSDNEALRNQFEDVTIPSKTLLPAKVIGFRGSPQDPQSLIIDQGSKSGVKKGLAVVVGRQLVGKVKEVSPYFAQVMLVTDKDFATLAQTLENDAQGIVKGFEEFIIFDHIVITDVIKKDETVVTKGEQDGAGVGIQPGLIIGKIEKVHKSETQPFQSATVKSLLDFNLLSTVFVVVQ